MSLKQAKKMIDRVNDQIKKEDSDSEDEEELQRQEANRKRNQKAKMFAISDSDDSYGEETPEPTKKPDTPPAQDEPKKKKKKNKKKKKADLEEDKEDEQPIDEELEFLDKIVKENLKEKEKNKGFKISVNSQRGILTSNTPSILQMDKKFFSYKREMKQLFADTSTQFGA